LLTTAAGHVIVGSVTAMNCADHLCDWLISVVDSNSQQWTHLTINDTEDY